MRKKRKSRAEAAPPGRGRDAGFRIKSGMTEEAGFRIKSGMTDKWAVDMNQKKSF